MASVRTNIVIDTELVRQVQETTGIKTIREAVDAALRFLLRVKAQERIRKARGKLRWVGDIDRMRRDR
jgi:Arc/MetJ family transcription regulator